MKKGVGRGAWGVGCTAWVVGLGAWARVRVGTRVKTKTNGLWTHFWPAPQAPSPKPQSSRPAPQAPRRASGFSLVAALFLIVVLAALGVFAIRIGAGQQQTVNLELMGARALSAAKSGVEWGAYQALNPLGSSCVASTTLNLTEASLNGFTVTVDCAPSTHTEGSNPALMIYRITARAQSGTYGTPDYVSRTVFATFSSTP